jgi:hypothetical protein
MINFLDAYHYFQSTKKQVFVGKTLRFPVKIFVLVSQLVSFKERYLNPNCIKCKIEGILTLESSLNFIANEYGAKVAKSN